MQSCSPIHESLLVLVPGRRRELWTLLESHVDTVPADDWPDTAFTPRVRGDLVSGRGACDDKGPLVAMILALGEILETGQAPATSVALLAAGDKEYAQTGIKHFAASNPALARAVIGEPTSLVPVLQHKGTVRWDITVHGRSAHSSQPELGRDAIGGAVRVIELLRQHQQRLRERFTNPYLPGPTITVTMIHGGRTRNAVADCCTLAVDFRVLPGMDPASARADVIRRLDEAAADSDPRGLEISHSAPQLVTPPLSTSRDDPFSRRVLDVCRRGTARPDLSFAGAPYGTDAAWVADRCPAIVLGPGSIACAHAVDEHIDVHEVVRAARLYHEVIMSGNYDSAHARAVADCAVNGWFPIGDVPPARKSTSRPSRVRT